MKNARAGRGDRVENIVGAHYLCRLYIVAVSFVLVTKGLAKLGNIVADANVSQVSRAGNMCCGNKFCCSETKNVFALESKTFLLPGHKCCVRNICFPV